MPRPSRPWFRVYVEICRDLKLQRLDPAERWLWIVVLCIARESPIPGCLLVTEDEPCEMIDIALWATMPLEDVERGIERMLAKGMLEKDQGRLFVVAWNDRQFESDDVTARTARFREKHRNVPTSFPGTDISASVSASVRGDHEKAESEEKSSDSPVVSPLWASCITVLREQVSDAVWQSTFAEIEAICRDSNLVLVVPNAWVAERIQGRYLNLIQGALTDVGSPEFPVVVELRSENLAQVHRLDGKRDTA